MPRTTPFFALNRAAALAASVSMLVPGLAAPVMAQNADEIAAACTAEFGSDAVGFANCVSERMPGITLPTTESIAVPTPEAGNVAEDAADAAAQAEVEAAAEAEAQVQAEAEAQVAAEAAAEAEEEAIAEREAAAEAAAEAEEEAAAEREAAAEAAAAAEQEAAAEREAAAQAAAEAEQEAAAEREAAALAAAEAEQEAAAEREAASQAEAEAAAARDAAAQAEAEAPAQAEEEATAAADAPVDGQGEVIETQAAEGTDGAEALQEAAEAPVATIDAPIAETETQSEIANEVSARPEPELTEEERTAVSQAESALGAIMGEGSTAAASAAADSVGDETASEAEVQEEVVAAEDVRTSDQDFETRAVVTEQEDRFDRGDKIMLGALGALAVGALLVNQNNRSRVVSNSGDRVVLQQDDGSLRVLRDDNVLLRQAGSNVRTERFDDGSTRQTVLREDGSRVVTIRDASLRVLRRELITENGERYTLIDDTAEVAPVDLSTLPTPVVSSRSTATDDPLAAALRQQEQLDRRFSLSQVRNIAEVRALAPAFDVSSVTFASGSAAIAPEQAANLRGLANEVLESIRTNPREVFLVEGHTDAVGDAAYNLALSDRRAESLALALNEYFGVPVENMVVQGYGESFLKVPTQGDERANRRATVRQITGLLQTAAAN